MSRKKITSILSIMLLAVFFVFSGKEVKAAGGTVYVTVEKFTLGQGYLVEPMAVTFNDGENYAQIFDRVMKSAGYTYDHGGSLTNNFYLSSISNADSGKINIPQCIQSMDKLGALVPPTNEAVNSVYPDLAEYSYCQSAGWYFFVNNKAPDVGMSGVKAQNGDVVRYKFTLYGYGADVGADTSAFGIKPLNLPNLDTVTKNLAVLKQYMAQTKDYSAQAVYNNTIAVISNMDNTETQVQAVGNAVAGQIKVYQDKIAAQNNPPAQNKPVVAVKKTNLKSVKRAGKNKVKITWKKTSGINGYQVYMSKKKKSGYKKVKTINNKKKVTITVSKLKRKKTYYFKVRTFKKVDGKKYYSNYSNIKKFKIR